MGGMNFLVGIATKDYVILAADKASIAYGAILSDTGSIISFLLYYNDFSSRKRVQTGQEIDHDVYRRGGRCGSIRRLGQRKYSSVFDP